MDYFTTNIFYFLAILIIPLAAQGMVMAAYGKYKKVNNKNKITGAEVARKILDQHGLEKVYVVETTGTLSDHYDPSRKVVRLSKDIFNGSSIASVAIAAHEVGHAIQDKDSYGFLRFRSLLVPIVNIANGILPFLLIGSFILGMLELIELAIGIMLITLLFQIITLPVEFNASNRAKKLVMELGIVDKNELTGVNKVLNAAALTYVASMLSTMLEILRLLSYTNRD